MTLAVGALPLLAETARSAMAGLPLQQLLLGLAVLCSVGTLLAVRRPAARLTRPLQDRLLYGVPWGTLVVCGLLLAVYYGLQGGLDTPNDPVVLPFRAWSYLDPTGMLLAGFSHASLGHLTGNLLGTLAFGSLAEYWWGHHVEHSTVTRWKGFWTDPLARAFLIFPVAAILVGIGGTLVALGPIIGFSTTVFAFAGFALVRYPIGTVVVGVGQGVLGRLVDAIQVPQQVAVAEASYSTPWFANIAVQGHLIGLLIGLLLGVAVLRRRQESPPPAVSVWSGLLLFAVSRALWAIYWFRGNETYVLYRALGLALVFVLVAIITVSIVAREEPLFPARAVPNPQQLGEAIDSITYRTVGLLALLFVFAVVAGPAIPVNLTTAADAELPGDPIEIQGYEITYGENVPNGQLSVIPASLAGERTQLNTSGVIVRNQDRHIWSTDVSTGELATDGEESVRIGGLSWQDSVSVERTGWQAVGGQRAYRVSLAHNNETRPVFASGPATAEPVIAGRRLSINATETAFFVHTEAVETTNASDPANATDTGGSENPTDTDDTANSTDPANDTAPSDSDTDPIVLTNVPNASNATATVRVPDPGSSVTVGPIRIVNRDDRLFAVYRGTVVRFAQKE